MDGVYSIKENIPSFKSYDKLNVSSVLEGSLRKAGNLLRINVRLTDVVDGYYIWSERYDRELEDVFAIQESIAENVAIALRGVLSPKEKDAIKTSRI